VVKQQWQLCAVWSAPLEPDRDRHDARDSLESLSSIPTESNLTGFVNLEISTAGKWLELLTEIAPRVKRVALIFNPDTAPGGGTFFLPVVEAAARSLNVEPITAPVRSDAEIEMVITALGREPGGGIVALPDAFIGVHRAAIISVAAKNKVPAASTLNNENSRLCQHLLSQLQRCRIYAQPPNASWNPC
jgi:ABC-type uncharacterized transport system substrate-binding protein